MNEIGARTDRDAPRAHSARRPLTLHAGKSATTLLRDATRGREPIDTDTQTPRDVVRSSTRFGIGRPRDCARVERGTGGIDVAQLQSSHAGHEHSAVHGGLRPHEYSIGEAAIGVVTAHVGGADHTALARRREYRNLRTTPDHTQRKRGPLFVVVDARFAQRGNTGVVHEREIVGSLPPHGAGMPHGAGRGDVPRAFNALLPEGTGTDRCDALRRRGECQHAAGRACPAAHGIGTEGDGGRLQSGQRNVGYVGDASCRIIERHAVECHGNLLATCTAKGKTGFPARRPQIGIWHKREHGNHRRCAGRTRVSGLQRCGGASGGSTGTRCVERAGRRYLHGGESLGTGRVDGEQRNPYRIAGGSRAPGDRDNAREVSGARHMHTVDASRVHHGAGTSQPTRRRHDRGKTGRATLDRERATYRELGADQRRPRAGIGHAHGRRVDGRLMRVRGSRHQQQCEHAHGEERLR